GVAMRVAVIAAVAGRHAASSQRPVAAQTLRPPSTEAQSPTSPRRRGTRSWHALHTTQHCAMAVPAHLDQHLKLLVEVAREHAIILLDPDGNIVWWNPAAERIFGAAAETVAGEHLSSLFTEEDRRHDLAANELDTARSHVASENDRWLVRADGSLFWAVGATSCLRDESGRVLGFGKILRNRTDLREQLDTAHNNIDQLREQKEHQSAFLSTLSHELRNPLAPLSSAAELLRRLPADSPQRDAFLDVVDRQVAMLSRLVDDLLDVARIGAGKVDLALQPVALQDVLRQAVDTVRSRIERHGHHLHFLVPSVPIDILADEQRLIQVFTNLLGNAIKYTPEGGTIWVKATIEENEAVARVQDDGAGIASDMLPRIFDLFTQVDRTRERSE